jgi:hypothetical protein
VGFANHGRWNNSSRVTEQDVDMGALDDATCSNDVTGVFVAHVVTPWTAHRWFCGYWHYNGFGLFRWGHQTSPWLGSDFT